MRTTLASLHPTVIRACALGDDNSLPRHMAIRLLASSSFKTKGNDLSTLLSNQAESSGIRTLAARELIQSGDFLASEVLLEQLHRESHPRLIQALFELLGANGTKACYDRLCALVSQRDWPASCLPSIRFALRLLRHRCELPTGPYLEKKRPLVTFDQWQTCPLPLKPANARAFGQAIEIAQRQLPAISLSNSYALQYKRGGAEIVVLMTSQLNSGSTITQFLQMPMVAAVLVALEEDQASIYGWVLSTPQKDQRILIEVFGMNGQRRYSGTGEHLDQALHFSLTAHQFSGEPALMMSAAIRKNQLLSGGFALLNKPYASVEGSEVRAISA
ncbi:MAG: hypothetical protein NWR72_16090 [Bacteroidia bacterium]|nr:hypothetical protein [Bacteroidia bacterium]